MEEVATLNVKAVPDGLYRRLRQRAARNRRSTAQETISIITDALGAPRPLLRDLRGLGLASEPTETALLSEAALAADWDRPEEDEAWSHLRPAE